MKFSYLIKFSPFLSSLLIIIFLCLTNSKEKTNLRILIWNTPTLSLGNYLAISSGTGFILSYIFTTKFTRINQPILKKSITSIKQNKSEESNAFLDRNNISTYEKTLIERDIKDPSPTINASFRIIGRTDGSYTNYKDTSNNNDYQNSVAFEFEDEFDEEQGNYETRNQVNSTSGDWYDESYSNW